MNPEPPKRRGRPVGSLSTKTKYGIENLQPGDSIDIPIVNKNTATSALHSAKSWAKRRGLTDAKFGTMTYHSRGVVRLYRRR